MKPLEGIKVLDLSRVLAGPWCTQLLADLGAEVIKVERPGSGDDLRDQGARLKDTAGNDTNERSTFLSTNRAKRSVTIDMAKRLGIGCTAGDIDLFDAANAEEMFLTSTSLCILPVKSFNGAAVGDGKTPGPITQRLVDSYSKDVGCDFVGQYLKFLN